MKLENQVCSLELAKKLKELGCSQQLNNGDWAWCMDCEELQLMHDDNDEGNFVGNNYLHRQKDWPKENFVKAFTVAELGEMLPSGFFTAKGKRFRIWFDKTDANPYDWEESVKFDPIDCDTEADARAKCLIYLLENKLLPVV